jgi:hypothetical protein
MKTVLNLIKLDSEMIYEPLWQKDRGIVINLLNSSQLKQEELLELARLHVRYQHLNNRYETSRMFKVLLRKSTFLSFRELNLVTQYIYLS